MIIKQNPRAASALLRLADEHRKGTHPRAPGLHVSDLIYCRRKAWYRRHFPLPEVLDEDTLALFLMGQGHHAVFQRCVPEKEEQLTLHFPHPGGDCFIVTGTPDMNLPDAPKLPGEIKTTRMSVNKEPVAGAPHYIEQVASYCLARDVHKCRLYVYHLNGGYGKGKGGMKPKMIAWDIRFTPEELDAWRDELTLRAFQVEHGNGAGGPPDAPGTHYKWECGYCPYNSLHGGPCPAPMGTSVGTFGTDEVPEWLRMMDTEDE